MKNNDSYSFARKITSTGYDSKLLEGRYKGIVLASVEYEIIIQYLPHRTIYFITVQIKTKKTSPPTPIRIQNMWYVIHFFPLCVLLYIFVFYADSLPWD